MAGTGEDSAEHFSSNLRSQLCLSPKSSPVMLLKAHPQCSLLNSMSLALVTMMSVDKAKDKLLGLECVQGMALSGTGHCCGLNQALRVVVLRKKKQTTSALVPQGNVLGREGLQLTSRA